MAKMVIIKGKEFNCKFVIKATGSTIPIELTNTDTGYVTVSTIGPDPEQLITNKQLTLGNEESMANGEFFLTLTTEETALLPFDNKFGEDGFPLSATIKMVMDIDTASEGKIYASVPQVYVENSGD